MFDPNELPILRETIQDAAFRERHLLSDLRTEVKEVLSSNVKVIKPRITTSVSLVASDGGNNKLEFDPFHFQLIRVVDSFGKQLCLDVVTPTTDTDELSRNQFEEDGTAHTALGQLMSDLKLRTLNELSPMIPDGKTVREKPEEVSPSWVLVYRDLCEWAILYEQICYKNFATDTLIVRDGLLRSKLFREDLFVKFCKLMEQSIEKNYLDTRRKIFLVGLAKRSKVLARYNLAMFLEKIFPAGDPRYVAVPRKLEAKAYVWPEYARGIEEEGKGEVPKFVAGSMYFVRFGKRKGDPIWTVDILSSQSNKSPEVFGYLLTDAKEGFPVPFYPRCLQKAHEHAEIVDFDLEILQNEVLGAVRGLLNKEETSVLEGWGLQGDVSIRRYK